MLFLHKATQSPSTDRLIMKMTDLVKIFTHGRTRPTYITCYIDPWLQMTLRSKKLPTTDEVFCPYFNQSIRKRFIFDESHIFHIYLVSDEVVRAIFSNCKLQPTRRLVQISRIQIIDIIYLGSLDGTDHLRSIGCKCKEISLITNNRLHHCGDSIEPINDATMAIVEHSNHGVDWLDCAISEHPNNF